MALKVKVKWYRYRPGVAQRVGRGIALLFHDRGTRRRWVFSSTPRPHFTPGEDPVSIYSRLGGPQDRSERVENLVPNGIRSRTFQPVISRYAEWATRPPVLVISIQFNPRNVLQKNERFALKSAVCGSGLYSFGGYVIRVMRRRRTSVAGQVADPSRGNWPRLEVRDYMLL